MILWMSSAWHHVPENSAEYQRSAGQRNNTTTKCRASVVFLSVHDSRVWNVLLMTFAVCSAIWYQMNRALYLSLSTAIIISDSTAVIKSDSTCPLPPQRRVSLLFVCQSTMYGLQFSLCGAAGCRMSLGRPQSCNGRSCHSSCSLVRCW